MTTDGQSTAWVPTDEPELTTAEDGTRSYLWPNTVCITTALHQRTRTGKYPVTAHYQGTTHSLGEIDLQNLQDRHTFALHCGASDGAINWIACLLMVAGLLAGEAHDRPAFNDMILRYGDLMHADIPRSQQYTDWLYDPSLTMVYGPRGVGKSRFLMSLATHLTAGGTFLTWKIHQTADVLYVDGEMTLEEIQDNACRLAGERVPEGLHFLTGDIVFARTGKGLTLQMPEDRQAVDHILDARPTIRILILDNISCLFPGISEDKKQDWEPINAWLIGLRHRGITVFLAHHAGKSGQQRGTSGREDSLNTVIALSLPPGYTAEDGCHFHLRFEKSRRVKGRSVEGLDVKLEADGDELLWTQQPLVGLTRERVLVMLGDGVPPRVIADELHVTASYVYRLKRSLAL